MTLDFGLLNTGKKTFFGEDNLTLMKNAQVKDDSGVPQTGLKEGTMIINTAEARLYVVTKGSADSPTVGHWKLNESSGTTASDSSGAGNNGTATSAAAWTPGKFNNGYDVNANEIAVPADTDFDFTGDFTIEFWIKPDVIGENTRILERRRLAQGADRLRFTARSDNLIGCEYLTSSVGGVTISVTEQKVGEWIHVAAVKDDTAGTLKLYINGILEATDSSLPVDPALDSDLYIGSDIGGGSNFSGIIDDVKIWTTVRTQEQIVRDSLESSGLVWTYVNLIAA